MSVSAPARGGTFCCPFWRPFMRGGAFCRQCGRPSTRELLSPVWAPSHAGRHILSPRVGAHPRYFVFALYLGRNSYKCLAFRTKVGPDQGAFIQHLSFSRHPLSTSIDTCSFLRMYFMKTCSGSALCNSQRWALG